jgi:hypothetical protein
MRATIAELWDTGKEFTDWWSSLRDEVRLALILTAMEEMPTEGIFSALMFVVCPELVELNSAAPSDSSTATSTSEAVPNLMLKLVRSDEHNSDSFSFDKFLREFEEDSAPSEAAQSAMKLVRSCLLLQFGTAMILLFSNTKDDSSLRVK